MFWKRKPKKPKKRQIASSGDPELDALHVAIAKRRDAVAELELELFDVEATLARFVLQLEAQMGKLETYIETLQTKLDDALRKAERYAIWGDRTDDAYNDVAEQYRRAWQTHEPHPDVLPAPEEPLDAETEAEIKALYRALAKRFHPDLTSDPDDKQWHEQLMAQVNAAYAARDLAALRKLAEQPDHNPNPQSKTRPGTIADTRDVTITALRAEIERLNGVIAELEQELQALADIPLARLRVEVELARVSGRNLLDEMVAELHIKISQLEAELAALGDEPD